MNYFLMVISASQRASSNRSSSVQDLDLQKNRKVWLRVNAAVYILRGNMNDFPGNMNDFPGNMNDFPGNMNDFPGNMNDFTGNINDFPGNMNDFTGHMIHK